MQHTLYTAAGNSVTAALELLTLIINPWNY